MSSTKQCRFCLTVHKVENFKLHLKYCNKKPKQPQVAKPASNVKVASEKPSVPSGPTVPKKPKKKSTFNNWTVPSASSNGFVLSQDSPIKQAANMNGNSVGDTAVDLEMSVTDFVDVQLVDTYAFKCFGIDITSSFSEARNARFTRVEVYALQQGALLGETADSTLLILSGTLMKDTDNELKYYGSRTVAMTPAADPKYVKINDIDLTSAQKTGLAFAETLTNVPEVLRMSVLTSDHGTPDIGTKFQLKVVYHFVVSFALPLVVKEGTADAGAIESAPSNPVTGNTTVWPSFKRAIRSPMV